MWVVLDSAGNSGAEERIALLDRYVATFGKATFGKATFGKESVAMLLADREFIGHEWLNYLLERVAFNRIHLAPRTRLQTQSLPRGAR